MKTRRFLGLLWLALVVCLFPTAARAEDETKRIEALISQVENLKDAKFVRNGSNYDSKDAAKFLRGKWHSKEKEIHTAEEFIEKAASISSTSGKPYIIRFADGHEVKCADYLKQQLKK